MTRHLNGAHWSNGAQYHIEQCGRAIGLYGSTTVLHFQFCEDKFLGMASEDENCNLYGKLRYGFEPQGMPAAPERFIHIRAYHPNSLSQDPRTWAEHIVTLLANWRGSRDHAGKSANLWLDPFVGVSSGNEMNLHHENGQPDGGQQWKYQTVEHYTRIAQWDMAFWKRVDELVPERKALRVSPAFADGHEPAGYPADGEYTIPAVRDMLLASDLVGIHPYAILHQNLQSGALGKDRFWYLLRPFRPAGWEGPHDIGGVISQYPNLLYFVSECGTFTHSDRSRTQETWQELDAFYLACQKSGRVVGVTPFIWNSDGAHPQNTIWLNPELRGFMETAPRYRAADLPLRKGETPVPTPPPTPPPTPLPSYNPNPDSYLVGDGMLRKAADLKWTLLSDEVYRDPQQRGGTRSAYSHAYCDKGELLYHAKLGVIALPFPTPPDHR
jgi:hypothetical protein